jgi:hypothetical protein
MNTAKTRPCKGQNRRSRFEFSIIEKTSTEPFQRWQTVIILTGAESYANGHPLAERLTTRFGLFEKSALST